MKKTRITPFEENVANWYSDIVQQSELISYAPVKGTMFFRPHGYEIWKNIQKAFNKEFEKKGVEEVYFPMVFPEKFLQMEKDHVEGFAPEVLTITRVGEKELNEPFVIRPTSEVLFGKYFQDTLNSYKQLPVKLNQWVSVMRWENNTRPFLRNSEFLWQEGHTVHATSKEAKKFSRDMIKVYEKIANKVLLLPVIKGEKTKSERFAGAKQTYTIETILKDGQALQSGTSHYLEQTFAKAFDVKVLSENNEMYYPYQTSWGVSTRLIGALILTHSDNNGLVLPSKIAPQQVAILTLFADKDPRVVETAKQISKQIGNTRKVIDDSDKGIGYKSQEWEVKGIPIRIEIGPRDIEEGKVTIVVRNKQDKIKVNIEDVNKKYIADLLKKYDEELYASATRNRDEKLVEITSVEEIGQIVSNGKAAVAYWREDAKLEAEIKEKTGATIRCLIPSKEQGETINGSKSKKKAIFARAY